MADKFNEDEYQMYFFTNLNTSSQHRLIPCRRPTLREEGKVGYDMKIEMGNPGIPIFIQFKLPNRIKDTEKIKIKSYTNSDAPEFDFFISFRKNDKFRQHKMLRKTMKKASPSFAYYTSPRFYTREELITEFQASAVHLKSAFFCVEKIGAIKPNGKTESICYGMFKKNAILYPVHRSIDLLEFNYIAELANAKLNAHEAPFSNTIDDMLNYLQKHYDIQLPERKMLSESVGHRSPTDLFHSNFLMAGSIERGDKVGNKNKYNKYNDAGYDTKLEYLANLLYDKLGIVLCVYQRTSVH